jgi:hypothetical protein
MDDNRTLDELAPNLALLLRRTDDGTLLRQIEEQCIHLSKLAMERGGKPSLTISFEFKKYDQVKLSTNGRLTTKEPDPARTEAILFMTDKGLQSRNPLQTEMHNLLRVEG